MNNERICMQDIVKYGTYYYPADKHYYSGTVVQCDNCLKSNLKACIGYKNVDLCLGCADKITHQMPETVNFPMQPPMRIPRMSMEQPPFPTAQCHFDRDSGMRDPFVSYNHINTSVERPPNTNILGLGQDRPVSMRKMARRLDDDDVSDVSF